MEIFKNTLAYICKLSGCRQKQQISGQNQILIQKINEQHTCLNSETDQYTAAKKLCQKLQLEYLKPKLFTINKQRDKKILLLDLDKTLIYFCPKNGLLLRPYLSEFIRQINRLYSIYIFSSASKAYVNQILSVFLQKKVYDKEIQGVLTRQNCIKIKGKMNRNIYVKDLRVITKCSLSDILIIDDNPISYCVNQQNAIIIAPYLGQKEDKELQRVSNILKTAASYHDVRQLNSKFNFNKFFYPSQNLSKSQNLN